MLIKFYKQRLSTYISVFFITTFINIILLICNIDSTERWKSILSIGIVQVLCGVLALTEWNKLKKVKSVKISVSDENIMEIPELIIKQNTTLIAEYWLFKTNGEYLGIIRPSVPWYLRPLGIILPEDSFGPIIPVTYTIKDSNGDLIGKFKTSGFMKVNLKIYDMEENLIGTYHQNDWKNFANIRGELFNEDDEKILESKVGTFSGDFKLNDLNGKHWASLATGRFPLEYRKLFKDALNPLVKINPDLTDKERILLLSMVTYWFVVIKRL